MTQPLSAQVKTTGTGANNIPQHTEPSATEQTAANDPAATDPQSTSKEPATNEAAGDAALTPEDDASLAPQIKIAELKTPLSASAMRQPHKPAPQKASDQDKASAPGAALPQAGPAPALIRLPLFDLRPAISDAGHEEGDSTEASTAAGAAESSPDRQTLNLSPSALEVTIRAKDESSGSRSADVQGPAQEPASKIPIPLTTSLVFPAAIHASVVQQTAEAPTAPAPHLSAAAPATTASTQHPAAQLPPDSKPATQLSRSSYAEELMAETPKPQTQPLRSLSLEFSPDGAQDVRVRLAEHSGDVHISLHTTDPALSGRLTDGVHDLVGSLSSAGYDAQAWTPEHGRQNQRPYEEQRRTRRNPSTEANGEEFDGMMQQPLQEIL